MLWSSAFLLLILDLTLSYESGVAWKLAFNIHGSDGHNFGYGAKAWDDDTYVGTDETAFSADYKNYDVTIEIANFVAIVRHQDGVCEAARVWEFLTVGKTLNNYLDTGKTSRLKATHDNHTYSYISNNMVEKQKDPIFAVDGGLVFNWWYSNNGVRIGNSGTYFGGGLPGEAINDDDYHGLGNEFGASTETGSGSTAWWHDVSINQGDCWGASCVVQGTDHGTSLKDSTLYGQYAIYTSDEATKFPCQGTQLLISIKDEVTKDFDRIDRGENGFLNYDEVIFEVADSDNDGLISLSEYSEARAGDWFSDTATHAGVARDFKRIDKDEDGLLNFYEVAFDIADSNKDGELSLKEFKRARVEDKFVDTH